MPVLAKETSLFPETLLESADCPRVDSQWMVVYTKPRQEKSLARDLLRQTAPFYLPLVKKTLQYGRRRMTSFAPLFDGYSIGSNDFTQLCLGVDRDSEIVAFDYEERDDGVKDMLRMSVEGCHRNGIHSGICGQAPSDYPEMAQYLVEIGIDSMSLNPDTVLKTTRQVLEVESRLSAPLSASPERRLDDEDDVFDPALTVSV